MHLTNFNPVRIKQYPKGWVVEIQKRKWYGRKYWTHIIPVSGMPDEPWYFSSPQIAMSEALKLFRWELIRCLYRIEETDTYEYEEDSTEQTAVDWLHEQFHRSLMTVGYSGTKHSMPHLLKQAKDIERKQIVEAFEHHLWLTGKTNFKNGEIYYHSKYVKECR